ncbi:MAG: hypothetical protein IJD01_05000, partial [Clostridia bacterium]|nr:hypothetical protein [Clostridia bacterium]
MSLAYGIIALLSLCMVGVCVAADKKRDVWLLLVFVSVSICNLGYFMLSVSPNLSSALNSNRLSYLGSVFLPFFMLMMVLRFCGMKRPKPLMITLVTVGIVMLGITTSPGILPIYYSTVDIEIADGVTKLVREYGPLHMVYYVYLLGYMVSMVGIAIYAVAKKKIKSHLHTILLLCTVFCNILIWLIEQFLPRGFEWLSASYILTECLMLAIYRSMQSGGLMSKEGRTPSYTINVLLTIFLLLVANFVRVITMNTTPAMYVISHIVVLMIYLGILVSWGISVYDRIVNKEIRRHLIILVVLMMFWMLMRTLRHTVFLYVYPLGMWCWYAYYVSMILIPQLCLFATKYIGKPEDYKLPKKWYLMYIPSIIMILGILTNDLHGLAFHFHKGYEAGWDVYQRGVLYYIATAWIFACIALMIAELVKRCRVPGAHKTVWLPITMLGIGVAYTILYAVSSNIFSFIEMTAALCFTVVAIWESSIKTGLVQSNTHYEELLRFSGLGVAVVDHNYTVYYRSDDALPLSAEQMKETENGCVMLDGGIRLSGSEIRGGHTLWQEDLSELLDVLDELKELRNELEGSNAVSMQNYQVNKKIRALAEKNRLHDELHKQTAHQIERLNDWLKKLTATDDPKEKRELLRRIVVVGAYLKRRNNLVLVNEQDGIIKEEELNLSLKEMMKNLHLAGVNGASSVQFEKDLPADVAMKLFDFYEYVVENAFDGLSYLLARFFYRDDCYYACIDAVCDLDLTTLQKETISVSKSDENCYTLSFKIVGGDG